MVAEHSGHAQVAHHFEDAEQQHEAITIGMWAFLVTEVMFFGGLFLIYIVSRLQFPDGFAEASNHLNMTLAGVNTVVLLCSSLSVALAVHAAQTDKRGQLVGFLLLTILFAITFLGLKGMEYYHEYEEHLIPGLNFMFEGPLANGVERFFVVYFVMTGVHAIHMILGIGVMFFLLWKASRGAYSSAHFSPIEVFGLYWHFVDVIWVFLFPLLYLVGRHLT